ncbi:molybdenum cofactor guanylyltransferase [Candidatus Bathyarchaeota archaeon]|nr:molybdenum cofactor guanylyltransferase [Candidatus Bathyarchaeota archaeon]
MRENPINSTDLGVVILAGGLSVRMGRDKALIKLCGKPLLLHVVESVLNLRPDKIIVTTEKGNVNRYTSILPSSVGLTEDLLEGKGPLVGMISGMRWINSEYTLVLPCDTPLIKPSVLRFLYQKAAGVDAVIPKWPNGYIEPLQACYRTSSALKAAEETIRKGKRSCRDMIRLLNRVVYVNIDELRRFDPDLVTFFNINCKEELLRAEKFLRGVIQNPYQNIDKE